MAKLALRINDPQIVSDRQRARDQDLVARGLKRLRVKFGNFKGSVKPNRIIYFMKIHQPEIGLISLCYAYNSKKIVQAAIREIIRRKEWLTLESALHWNSNVTDERTKQFYQKRDLYALKALRNALDRAGYPESAEIMLIIKYVYEKSGDETGIVQTNAVRILLEIARKDWICKDDAVDELQEILAAPKLKCRMFDELIAFVKRYVNRDRNDYDD